MNDDLIGLRPEDLDPDARRRQEELLATAEGRREHDDALALGGALRALPGTGGPTEAAVRDRLRAPPRRWGLPIAALVAAALVVVAVGTTTVTSRERGVGAPRLDVHLEAAAEGPSGVRPLSREASVGPEERVLFRITTRGEGYLSLVEAEGGAIWPPPGQIWAASTGTQVPGGDRMVSYRPDEPDATLGTYVVTFCADREATSCVTDTLALRWAP